MEDMNDQALAVVEPQAPLALFGTNDPLQVIATAARVATALAEVVNERKLYAIVSGKKFPTVEAWTLLGSMLGVFPMTEWVHELRDDNGSVRGFEARVVARTLAGRIVGAGEARCIRGESKTWHAGAQEFALSSMAQTRATSKAMRGPLDFVFKLAGFQPTPAEEMDASAPTGEIPTSQASPETLAALKGAETVPSPQPPSPSAEVKSGAVAGAVAAPKSGPRAKRGNVVQAPAPAPPVAADDGQAAYLANLRQAARMAAAELHLLNTQRKNAKAALQGQPLLPLPPQTPHGDSDKRLAAFIANAFDSGELDLNAPVLAELDADSLAAVNAKLDELIASLKAGK